jgi:hypothetical protein
VATVVARNANEVIMVLMVGLAESVFGRSLELGSQFCVGAFGRNLASVAMKIFSHYFTKKFYKFCIFNTAINCITVQHKKRLIPVNFDW